MPKERILIVDDNELNLKLLRWLLEKNGYEVHTAGDAKTARVSVRAVRPRLVLMDIQLPDIDGLQLTREFKTDPELRDTLLASPQVSALRADVARLACGEHLRVPRSGFHSRRRKRRGRGAISSGCWYASCVPLQ